MLNTASTSLEEVFKNDADIIGLRAQRVVLQEKKNGLSLRTDRKEIDRKINQINKKIGKRKHVLKQDIKPTFAQPTPPALGRHDAIAANRSTSQPRGAF